MPNSFAASTNKRKMLISNIDKKMQILTFPQGLDLSSLPTNHDALGIRHNVQKSS